MARETKATREARELKEAEEYTRERAGATRASWHRRVALLLLDLRNEGGIDIQLSEDDDLTWLTVKDVTRRFWCTPFFPLDLPERFDDTLVLSHEIQLRRAEELASDLKRERRETERREKVRSDALEKLSAEEREVLGL